MYSNLDGINNKHNDHDLSVLVACKKFEELLPKEKQPEWLKYCMSMRTMRNHNKNWVIKMILLSKPELKSNQFWQWEDDGIPILFQIDPATKKKSVVICGGPSTNIEVFFEVEVDLKNDKVMVLVDTDLNKLDGAKYEINRR